MTTDAVTLGADLSHSQRERRTRILDAAAELASHGGYDGVQMRDVAERAEVALGTLYRYFPSKVHLLVSVMHEQTRRLIERLERRPPEGATAADRVLDVLSRATRALQRDQQVADAMIRALMVADVAAAPEVNAVNTIMTQTITAAIRANGDAPRTPDEDAAIARVIEQVWWATILAWLSGRSTTDQMHDDLAVAARLLLR